MFDGKIARTKKNRTEDEKRFGIQIDSLCDVVCFGVFPIVLCYELGMTHFYSIPILIFYGLAGVIRLGYFNVMEQYQKVNNPKDLRYHFFNNVDFDYLSSLRKNPKVFGPFELASKQDNGFSPLFIDGYDLNKK